MNAKLRNDELSVLTKNLLHLLIWETNNKKYNKLYL